MYDKFGEFDYFDEINKAAEGQKNEGDQKALIELAEENGIDIDNAEDYFTGDLTEFCTPLEAAFGKLEVEKEDLKPKDIMEDWWNYIMAQCADDEDMVIAVRRKGKSLKGCIGVLLKWSYEHQQTVDKDIINAAGIKGSRVTIGIPGARTAHQLIREYYLGGKK